MGRWKGCQGSHGISSLRHTVCVLCSTIAITRMGHVKMYLEVLCIMIGLELPSLATNGYTKGLIGSCHNPDATNTAIWKTRPACPLIHVWTIKALQCNENIFLDSEDVNVAVYRYCQPTSSRRKPQSNLSGCLSILKKKKYWWYGRATLLLIF